MQKYHIKGNGGIGMLSAEEIFSQVLIDLGFAGYKPSEMSNSDYWLCTCTAMRIYRNQGIQQASEVCSEMLTDGFRISNVQAVLALKEEV